MVVAFKERIRLFNVLRDSLQFVREARVKTCRTVRFAHNGGQFACGVENGVTIYNTFTFEPWRTFTGHIKPSVELAWYVPRCEERALL